MSHYQNQYDANPTRQTDEYGHPIDTTGTGTYGTQVPYGTAGATGHHQGHHQKEHGGLTGMLHRSGSSSSSSSSEDDGHGGRRKKKGLKDKLKEKLPGKGHGDDFTPAYGGGHKADYTPGYGSTTTPGGYGAAGQPQEKKGMMDKIKEKLPGGHHH